MAKTTEPTQPLFDPAALLQGLLLVQQSQLEVVLAWQRAIASLQQELWDEWLCRWGGGAPIDA